MNTTNKLHLWRQFSSLFFRDLRPVILSHNHRHFQSQSLSSFSSSSFVYNFTRPANVSHKLLLNFPKTFSVETTSPESTGVKPRRCWNCSFLSDSELFLVCDSCRCIQPVDTSVDYFQIFGLERQFEIEEGSLEGKYKDWQKKLHPDLVHSKSKSEREYAAEQSSRVIDAYRTLKSSLSRAVYLMKLTGVHVDEEQTVSDPELLAEIMEIRESVEDAADSQALKQIHMQVQEKMKQWSESFASAFKNQDTEKALDAIRRMTYYKRANEEIVKRL